MTEEELAWDVAQFIEPEVILIEDAEEDQGDAQGVLHPRLE